MSMASAPTGYRNSFCALRVRGSVPRRGFVALRPALPCARVPGDYGDFATGRQRRADPGQHVDAGRGEGDRAVTVGSWTATNSSNNAVRTFEGYNADNRMASLDIGPVTPNSNQLGMVDGDDHVLYSYDACGSSRDQPCPLEVSGLSDASTPLLLLDAVRNPGPGEAQ